MNKSRSIHEKIVPKVEGLIRRIKEGYPLPGGAKMIDQDAEAELLEIIDWYSEDISGVASSDVKKLVEVFKKCKKLDFWNMGTEKRVEEVIDNLLQKT